MGLRIRPMEPTDYDALHALDDAVMRYAAQAFLGFDWDAAPPARKEQERAITPDAFVFYLQTGYSLVAEEDREIVGYILAQPLRHFDLEPLAIWVEDISVHPVQHRRGVATALYHALHDRAQGACATVILAGIHRDNVASLAMHRRVGFEIIETRAAVWRIKD